MLNPANLRKQLSGSIRVYKEAKYLAEQGFNIEILCWDRKCEYKTEENIGEIKIRRFHILSKPGTGLKQLGAYIKFITSVRKFLKNKEYKYLHCHDFDGILAGLLTKDIRKCKLIFDMHEIYAHYAYAKNIFFNIIFKYVLRKSNYIIYVNNQQINHFSDKNKKKLIYLPNYPELEYYDPIKKNEGKKIRINYIGSLRDYDSLKALAETAIKNSQFEIGLYGTGICYDRLKQEYENKKIAIYGKYDGIKDSGNIYRNTDILYCVYNPEIENWKNAYPVKLFEAIITETPIIVAENTEAGNFVNKHFIGMSVKYGDVKKLQEAIEYIKENYNKFKQSIKKISNNYNWEEIVKELEIIYN